MALVHALRFINSIEGDSALQARITAANWDTKVVLLEGAARGFLFTSTEFQTALDQKFGVLSEETLANAAGGKSEDAGNDKHPNPPPGQTDERGVWSPPPGDVSGNSCLFGWRG